jgi:hypothetical protein
MTHSSMWTDSQGSSIKFLAKPTNYIWQMTDAQQANTQKSHFISILKEIEEVYISMISKRDAI